MRRRTKIRTTLLAAAFAAAALPAALPAAADGALRHRHEISLLERRWTPAPGVSAQAARALADRARALGPAAVVHVLVQLHEIPGEAARAELAAEGLHLGAYVPDNAWIASISADRLTGVLARPEIRYLEPWTPARKVHPRAAAGTFGPWARSAAHPGWVMTFVVLHDEVDLARGKELAAAVGGQAAEPVVGLHGMTVWLPEERIAQLAEAEEVLWIADGPPPLSATNDGVRTYLRSSPLTASPYGLNGFNVELLVYDEGAVDDTHETFDPEDWTNRRVTRLDDELQANHATHVAGTAAGDGDGSPGLRGQGVAPNAWVLSAGYEQDPLVNLAFVDDVGDIESDFALARSEGADLATVSLGSNLASSGFCILQGEYETTSWLIDRIVRGEGAAGSPYVTVWSNGNERVGGGGACGAGYFSMAEPACAKNPIFVGAVHADGGAMTGFSSWGPCDDGRMKPTVVAPGCETGRVTGEGFIYSSVCGDHPLDEGSDCTDDFSYGGESFCGTSMAAPAVAGVVTLLLDDWFLHHSSTRPLPALVKAMVIHSAHDLGPAGPDYRFGHGAVDAKALIDLFRAGTGVLTGPGPTAWGTDQVAAGQTDSFAVLVPAGAGELRASLAWDDPAAFPGAAEALVNDLDLWLVAPDGTIHRPWLLDPANPGTPAVTGINERDNDEAARVVDPAPGLWTVRVAGTAVPSGPQKYGLVYSIGESRIDPGACFATQLTFEQGLGGVVASGASVVAAPGPGNGASSLKLGGVHNAAHEAMFGFQVPAGHRTLWSFDLWMQTQASAGSYGDDELYAEVRPAGGGAPLAVLSLNGEGEEENEWLPQVGLDLSRWAGQTVTLAFVARTDGAQLTTFWVDDVVMTSCDWDSQAQRASFASLAAEDGHVKESSEASGAGGTVSANNAFLDAFYLGDGAGDEQYRGVLSFDTSSLPDGATVLWARLRLRRTGHSGEPDAMATHGLVWADLRLGGLSGNQALEPTDFQAAVTAGKVTFMSPATVDGSYSYGVFDGGGVAGINKTGRTQVRLAFTLDDDDDATTDVVHIGAGEHPTALYRPTLEVYYLP